MSGKKIVIALGGNALQPAGEELSAETQLRALEKTCRSLSEICALGYRIVIVHGNGPQIGRIVQVEEEAEPWTSPMPFDVCGAMSQGYIGYQLQQMLDNENLLRGIDVPVSTVITQVVVDRDDPAFLHPTKPIGAFYSPCAARRLAAEKGYEMAEDSGRGWRRVVPSPRPIKIVELDSIRELSEKGVVIACGGGGVPIIEGSAHGYRGIPAVIDKDHAARLLADELDADILLILTGVEQVCLDDNTEKQKALSRLDPAQAEKYIEEGQFAPGSMLPKVRSAVDFVRNKPGRRAVITSLDRALDALNGTAGTVFEG